MKTGLHQHTSLRQDLRINPRLYQAMDLLYMPLLDLEQHLKQELLGNPFLEMIEPEEEVQAPAAEQQQQQQKTEKEKAGDDEPDWESILLDDRTEHGVPSGTFSDAREYIEPVTVEGKDLIDYLREQTQMLDLTPRQLAVLDAVADSEGPNQTELVNRTGIDRSTLSDVVRRLQKRRLLQRRRTKDDARAYAIGLTDKGREVLRTARPIAKQTEEQVLAALTSNQRKQLIDALKSIIGAVQQGSL